MGTPGLDLILKRLSEISIDFIGDSLERTSTVAPTPTPTQALATVLAPIGSTRVTTQDILEINTELLFRPVAKLPHHRPKPKYHIYISDKARFALGRIRFQCRKNFSIEWIVERHAHDFIMQRPPSFPAIVSEFAILH
jgi:hypothetical protein